MTRTAAQPRDGNETNSFHLRIHDPDQEPEVLAAFYAGFEPKGEFSGLPPVTEEARLRWLRSIAGPDFGHLILVETRSGRTAGHAYVAMNGDRSEGEVAIFLDRPFRHRHLGSELFGGLLRWCCRTLHLRHADLLVERGNQPAMRLYRKFGFLTEGAVDLWEPDVTLARELSCPRCAGQGCPIFGAPELTSGPGETPVQTGKRSSKRVPPPGAGA